MFTLFRVIIMTTLLLTTAVLTIIFNLSVEQSVPLGAIFGIFAGLFGIFAGLFWISTAPPKPPRWY